MIPPNLKNYINRQRVLGKSDEFVKEELIKSGWPRETVERAFEVLSEIESQNVPGDTSSTLQVATPTQPEQTSAPPTETGAINYFLKLLSGKKRVRLWLIILAISGIASIQPTYTTFKYGIPFINNLDQRVSNFVEEVFPEDLEIRIQNGEASTNVTEPYYLTVSQSTLNSLTKLREQQGEQPHSKIRLLTLDTYGSVEDFERHQSLFMITKKNLVYYGDNGIQILPLSEAPDMVVTRSSIEESINEINKNGRIVHALKTLAYLSPLIITLLYGISLLLKIIIGSFLAWIVNKILQANIPFRRIFSFMGVVYAIPAMLLIIIRTIPSLQFLYSWADTALDVLVLSLAYVLISSYKRGIQQV